MTKYSEEFTKPDYSKCPYPTPHSIGKGKLPPDGDAQPRLTGDILLASTDKDDLGIGLSYDANGVNGDFGPFIQRHGEGLPNSFNLNFTNTAKFSAGNVHPHTGLLLFALGLNLRPKAIIETGTFYGYSTLYLARICETWKEGKVYTIDTNDTLIEEEVRRNPYIECINGDSKEVLPRLLPELGEVQMAFIDSWKRIAWSEFRLIDPYLAEGGVVVFHDTQFLNTGKALYQAIMQNYSHRYDTMLFTGKPHKDNPHAFFGNCDDRGLFVIRKRPTESPFYNVPDYASRQLGANLF